MNKKSVWLIGALVFAASFSGARASTIEPTVNDAQDPTVSVLYSQSSYVLGSASTLTTLQTPGAGELFLTLTDLDSPAPFASLKFSLSSSDTALVGLADPGTLTLDVGGATTLYADVVAVTQGKCDPGLYNLTATFVGDASPVPLPASGVLLAGALLVLLAAVQGGRLGRALRLRQLRQNFDWRGQRAVIVARA